MVMDLVLQFVILAVCCCGQVTKTVTKSVTVRSDLGAPFLLSAAIGHLTRPALSQYFHNICNVPETPGPYYAAWSVCILIK